MAKRRHHRKHRRYGGLVSVPSLGSIKEYNPLGKSVNSTDVLVGAGVGLAGSMAIKYLLAQVPSINNALPQIVKDYITPISAVAAGVVAYMVQRKSHRGRATGHLVGAMLTAAVPTVSNVLKSTFPSLAGLVSVDFGMLAPSPRMGLLMPSPRLNGLMASAAMDNQSMLPV